MNDFRLTRIDPISVGADRPIWEDQHRQHAYYPRRNRPNSPKKRLIEALAPSFAADDCDIEFTTDLEGEVTALAIIDRLSAEVIARCSMAEVRGFFGEGAAGGLLVDRKG
jgi:hypothetical protein